MESFNIIYFGSKTNSKIIISLDTYTTQNLKQLLWKIVSTIHYDSACSANKKYGKFTYK